MTRASEREPTRTLMLSLLSATTNPSRRSHLAPLRATASCPDRSGKPTIFSSLQPLEISCSFFRLRRSLFSMPCSLFCTKQGGGGIPSPLSEVQSDTYNTSVPVVVFAADRRGCLCPRRHSCKGPSDAGSNRPEEKVPGGIHQRMDQSGRKNRIAFPPRPAVKKTRNRSQDHIAPVGKT